jgi:Big-like domain-containing protein
MRIMQPRTGLALVGAALLATGVTSMAVAAQDQAAQPPCYSTCPPNIDLKETFHVLHVGAEEIERFSVRVGPDFIGATSTPTGTVTIKAGSTVLCTITLTSTSRGRGSCSPPASVLPAGHYVVIAYYSGDSTFSPAQSHPRQLEIIHAPGGGGD